MNCDKVLKVVAVAALGILAGCGGGGAISDFEANNVQMDSGGRVVSSGKIYVSGDKIRMEQAGGAQGGQMTVILRRDLGVMWTVMPERKSCMEMPLDEKAWQNALQDAGSEAKVEELGRETVNGFDCRKYRTVTEIQVMMVHKKTTTTVWRSPRLLFPVRTRSENGQVNELRDVKPGKQPASLFEIPAGYSKMSMPNLSGLSLP